MEEQKEIRLAARRVIAGLYKQLLIECPDGNYENSPFYKWELKELFPILEDIAAGRHPFGRYAVRLGYDDRRYGRVFEDICLKLVDYLVNGPYFKGVDPKSQSRRDARDAYIDSRLSDKAIESEHLAIYEAVGTFIKKTNPGCASNYYRLD